MHTTRNRLFQSSRKGAKPRSAREDQTFMLRQGAPPQSFPTDLIVPPHRGAVITAAPWPVAKLPMPPAPTRPTLSHPGLSRKAAKKAARQAAARERAQARPAEPPSPPDSAILATVRIEPACAPALALPPEPEPEPEPEPGLHAHRSAPAEAVSDHAMPLPTARALVPRRQGFVDVLAFMLRNSGRRLARWSSAKRRSDEMKEKLAKAEARMRAMEAQLAALQALQERVRQS